MKWRFPRCCSETHRGDRRPFPAVRGWFDICTQGPSALFQAGRQYGFPGLRDRLAQTGTYFSPETQLRYNGPAARPLLADLLRNVCSALSEEIELAKTKPWDWIITFHPADRSISSPDTSASPPKRQRDLFEGPDECRSCSEPTRCCVTVRSFTRLCSSTNPSPSWSCIGPISRA